VPPWHGGGSRFDTGRVHEEKVPSSGPLNWTLSENAS
jgi:hypothetical protein